MTLSAAHSNAYNNLSFVNHSVDPRTGQYTLGIDLMAVVGNYLIGPNLPLRLAFNALTPEDTGFGKGWTLNLSRYTPTTSSLQVHTGEQFHVDGGGAEPKISEQKLKSFRFLDDGNGEYRIVHRTGMVEQLKVIRSGGLDIAVPHRVYAPSGRWIELSHEGRFGEHRCLSSIVDRSGLKLLSVTYENNLITYHLHPDFGETRYEVALKDRRVERVTLPSHDRGSWRFKYESNPSTQNMTCLTRVETPQGSIETITYDDDGHQLLAGAPVARIPRVKTHTVDPLANQPALTTTYSYPNDRNFLGFGSGLNWEKDKDNLYRASSDYFYEVHLSEASEGKELRKASYRYNRHHLLTLQTTAQYGDVIEDVTEDARKQDWHIQETETVYHEIPNVGFEYQLNNFQQPYTVTQRWRLESDSTALREEVTTTEYDPEHGNLILEEQPNGIVTTYAYYDKDGEDGCPPDPQGFQRSVKSTTTTPSKKPGLEGQARVLLKHYRYTPIDCIVSKLDRTLRRKLGEYWLEVERESLYEGSMEPGGLLSETNYVHIRSTSDSLRHGRIESQTVVRNEQETLTTYGYEILTPQSHPILEETQTVIGFDHDEVMEDGQLRDSSKEITVQHSVLFGEPMLSQDDNDVKIAYEYDGLRRVVKETVSPDDPDYEASRRYQYFLTSTLGQQASQIEYNVSGVATQTYVNGNNKVVKTQRYDADAAQASRRDTFRTNYEAYFDPLGNLIAEDEYDWLGDKDLVLSSTMLFDSWGQQYCEIGPDHIWRYDVTDPIGTVASGGRPIQTSWTQTKDGKFKTGKSITWLNVFDKPVQVERVRLNGGRESLHRYYYDGLGRTVREVDARQAITRFEYDAFDRLVKHTLADNSVVLRDYARYTDEDKPVKISVNGKLLGEQVFDGLGRMIRSITGGRPKNYFYKKGQLKPSQVKTPKGGLIDYDYVPKLSEKPILRRSVGVDDSFVYDRKNARLMKCVENGVVIERDYFSTGELRYESRSDGGSELYEMHYEKSLRARDLGYTDVFGARQKYEYDEAGRLESTSLGTTHAVFTYDELGRMRSFKTTDGEQWLETILSYDDFDRECERIFRMPGEVQVLMQRYDGCDALVERKLLGNKVTLREEHCGYDPRARLISYTCSGPLSPEDPYGKIINSQDFEFDEVDNITFVTTRFFDATGTVELKNLASYNFENELDPAQLTSMTNSHEDYPSFIEFTYDKDGNLTRDEQQRVLEYDVFGRLSQVSLPDGRIGDYGYDATDRLISQSGTDAAV